MAYRSRTLVVEDLESTYRILQHRPSDLLLKELKTLTLELADLNRLRSETDDDTQRFAMRKCHADWAARYQELLDDKKITDREISHRPKDPTMDFDGENGQAFWSYFKAAVYDNKGMRPDQKMLHLIARVAKHANASKLVASFKSDGTQFKECVATFRENYISHRQIQADLMREAKQLKALRTYENPVELQLFISQVRSMTTRMRIQNEAETNEYHTVMREVILKLAEPIRNRFYEFHYHRSHRKRTSKTSAKGDQPIPMMESMVRFLEERESIAGIKRYAEGSVFSESPSSEKRVEKRGTSLHGNSSKRQRLDPEQEKKVKAMLAGGVCVICEKKHPTGECTAFDPDERYKRLKGNGVCVQCTKHLHDPDQKCPEASPCTNCKSPTSNHHKVICKQPRAPRAFNAVTLGHNPKRQVCLSTLKANIKCGDNTVVAQVLLDDAAETSIISSDMIHRLQTKAIPTEPLLLSGVTDGYERIQEMVTVEVTALDGSFASTVWAYVSPRITSERIRAPSQRVVDLAKDKGIEVQPCMEATTQVDILIGQDCMFPFLSIPGRVIPLGPLIGAFESKLGWYIAGNEYNPQSELITIDLERPSMDMTCQVCEDLTVIFEMPDLDDEEDGKSWQAFEESIEYDAVAKSYTVRLPIRSMERLGNNYFNTVQQLHSQARKLRKRGEYNLYHEAIMSYTLKNYAEKVKEQIVKEGMFFLPHHDVRKVDSLKTQLRVVFNASSAVKGQRSLNQCLSKGMSINADIWAVTVKFRMAPIVLMTDLVKAFSQIRIHEKDRNLLCFLWFENPEDTIPTIFRMSSVIFGATCSPYLLGAVIRAHGKRFQEEYPDIVAQLKDGLYMDDGALAAKNNEEARILMSQATEFFEKASFQLHPWLSNATELDDGTFPFGDLDATHKCLGLQWNPRSDMVNVKAILAPESPSSRRDAVSTLSKFYDPLSWFAPIKTRIRLFIRDMAVESRAWDRSLGPEEESRFGVILGELKSITDMSIPRTVSFAGIFSLQIFCDASPQAMGAVAYLVGPNCDERMLICAKVKLAPKKLLNKARKEEARKATERIDATVPRLELQAAVIGVKLCDDLLQRLPEAIPVALYSDSEVTLHRIRNDPNRYDLFEMRRLMTIQEFSTPQHWHHIRSQHNPADMLTKDFNTKAWLHSENWWKGPSMDLFNLARPMPQQRRSCFVTQTKIIDPAEQEIMQLGYDEALRRMVEEWKSKVKDDPALLTRMNAGKERPLSIEGIARTELWKLIQQDSFPEDIARLKRKLMPATRSRIKLLRPFLDEWGILRSTRLAQLSELDWEAKHPIIIRGTPMVRSFIRKEHERFLHDGMRDFRNHLNLYYHLMHARRTIRSVIGTCLRCNFLKGKPFMPADAVLPSFRIECSEIPFLIIGLDFAGPIRTWNGHVIQLMIATCTVTRALHREITTSVDAIHCLQALERLFARRGVPREIHSDNASNFEKTNKVLAKMAKRVQEIAEKDEVEGNFRIKWDFQTPRAPWTGGYFERMIRTVKGSIENTPLRRAFDMEEILTLMCQVEAIVNSRPLVEASPEGLPALTPAHFFAARSLIGIPPFPGKACEVSTDKRDDVFRNYLGFRTWQDSFWNRFKNEYILSLNRQHATLQPSREPREGELVLLINEKEFGKNRYDWPLARISKLLPTGGKATRTVQVERNGKFYNRAVQTLVPLEATRTRGLSPPPEDEMSRIDAFVKRHRADQSGHQRAKSKRGPSSVEG